MEIKVKKWNFNKRFFASLLVGIVFSLAAVPQVQGELIEDVSITRYEGYSRDHVAENVAKAHFSDSKKVILVNRDKFPDAISATNISQGQYPVLYTHSGKVTEGTLQLIQSMPLDEIYVLGGTLSVSDAVIEQLEKATNVKVTRVAGRSRYDANVSAIKMNFHQNNHVVLASGEVYADALYGVSYANTIDAPVVLTHTNRLEASTLQILKDLGVKQATIIGGELTVTPEVEKQLSQLGISHDRIAGRNRYIGSAEIAKASYPTPENVVLASGEVFSDALVSAPLAQKLEAPILLVQSNRMDKQVGDYIRNHLSTINNINILGGPLTIEDTLLEPLFQEASAPLETPIEEDMITTQRVERTYSIAHEVDYVVDSSLAHGETRVVKEGVDGKGTRLYLQTLLNGEVLDEEILSEEVTTPPVSQIIHMGQVQDTDKVDIAFNMELFNQEVLHLVNEERTRLNLQPLSYEAEMQQGADLRTLDSISIQTLYSDHTRPDRSPWYTAFDYLANHSFVVSGENIAYNWITYEEYEKLAKINGAIEAKLAEMFYNQYANSPGHYRNMIRDNFDGMAVSTMFANHDNSTYYIRVYNTMVFSRR